MSLKTEEGAGHEHPANTVQYVQRLPAWSVVPSLVELLVQPYLHTTCPNWMGDTVDIALLGATGRLAHNPFFCRLRYNVKGPIIPVFPSSRMPSPVFYRPPRQNSCPACFSLEGSRLSASSDRAGSVYPRSVLAWLLLGSLDHVRKCRPSGSRPPRKLALQANVTCHPSERFGSTTPRLPGICGVGE